MQIKWKDIDIKDKLAIITAIAAFLIGWGLTISGFFMPPVAEVADSILWILGQAMIYAASVFGVSAYFTSSARQMKRDMRDYFDRRLADEELRRMEEHDE